MLPAFLAARLPETLAAVEDVVAAAEPGADGRPPPTQEALAARLRPNITLLSALRWLRRRIIPVRHCLVALRGLQPQLLADCAPCLADFRRVLCTECVLVNLRGIAGAQLDSLPTPFGFAHRLGLRGRPRRARPHNMGTDPPPQ